jgi:hypothetical protein
VAESLRSTLREQLPQVIPLTLIFRACLGSYRYAGQ